MAKAEEIGILLLSGTSAEWLNGAVGEAVTNMFGTAVAENLLSTLGKRKPTLKRWVTDRGMGRDSVRADSPLYHIIKCCWLLKDGSTNPTLNCTDTDELTWQSIAILCSSFSGMVAQVARKLIENKDRPVCPEVITIVCDMIPSDQTNMLTVAELEALYRKARVSFNSRQYQVRDSEAFTCGNGVGTTVCMNLLTYILGRYSVEEEKKGTIGDGLFRPSLEDEFSECRAFIHALVNPYGDGFKHTLVEPYARQALRDRFPFAFPDSLDADRNTPEINIHRAAEFTREWRNGSRIIFLHEAATIIDKAVGIITEKLPERNIIRDDVLILLRWCLFASDPLQAFHTMALYLPDESDTINLFSAGIESANVKKVIIDWCEEHKKMLEITNTRAFVS